MGSSPRLEEVMEHAINNRLDNFFTALPARVEYANPNAPLVNLRIIARNKVDDGSDNGVWYLPIVSEVPVLYPWGGIGGSNPSGITFPLKEGDYVLYIVCTYHDRTWYSRGSALLTEDPVMHNNLGSGFCVPGLSTNTDRGLPVDQNALVIHGDHIKIGGTTGTEPTIKADTFWSTPNTGLKALLTLMVTALEPGPAGPMHTALAALSALAFKTTKTEVK
jgi:hypothetical protein